MNWGGFPVAFRFPVKVFSPEFVRGLSGTFFTDNVPL